MLSNKIILLPRALPNSLFIRHCAQLFTFAMPTASTLDIHSINNLEALSLLIAALCTSILIFEFSDYAAQWEPVSVLRYASSVPIILATVFSWGLFVFVLRLQSKLVNRSASI